MKNLNFLTPPFVVTNLRLCEHSLNKSIYLVTGNFEDSYSQSYLAVVFNCSDGREIKFFFRNRRLYNIHPLSRFKGKHSFAFYEKYLNESFVLSIDFVLKMLYDSRFIRK